MDKRKRLAALNMQLKKLIMAQKKMADKARIDGYKTAQKILSITPPMTQTKKMRIKKMEMMSNKRQMMYRKKHNMNMARQVSIREEIHKVQLGY